MENGHRSGLLPKIPPMSWDFFDSLPREAKEIFWYAHSGKLGIKTFINTPEMLQRMRDGVTKNCAKFVLKTYGPDHPQAFNPFLTLDDLEL